MIDTVVDTCYCERLCYCTEGTAMAKTPTIDDLINEGIDHLAHALRALQEAATALGTDFDPSDYATYRNVPDAARKARQQLTAPPYLGD